VSDDLRELISKMNPKDLMKLMNPPNLKEISDWMNFRCREVTDGKWVVLTEDHRGVLPVIALALKKELFVAPPTLLRLDRHADYEDDPQMCLFHGSDCTDYLRNITDTQVHGDDSTWLRVAVHAGYIGNAGTWYVDDRESKPAHVILDKESSQSSYDGNSHSLWFTGNFSSWLAKFQAGDLDAVAMATGCKLQPHGEAVIPIEEADIWLDIDLDFAATTDSFEAWNSGSTSWTEANFDAEFKSGSGSASTLENIIDAARLITIATEPTFCGGYLSAAETLARLHKNFPKFGVFDW